MFATSSAKFLKEGEIFFKSNSYAKLPFDVSFTEIITFVREPNALAQNAAAIPLNKSIQNSKNNAIPPVPYNIAFNKNIVIIQFAIP